MRALQSVLVCIVLATSAPTPAAAQSLEPGPGLDGPLRRAAEGLAPPQRTGADLLLRAADLPGAFGLLASLDAQVGTVAGDVITATVPVWALERLAEAEEIAEIEAARPVRALLDEARAVAGVDKVLQGVDPAGDGFDGTGVVVGVADLGLDVAHPAFAGADGGSRVAGLWDTAGAGAPPSGQSYGNLCSASDIGGGGCGHVATKAHGTHVTSIAAGSHGEDNGYGGVAPGATILFADLTGKPPGVSGEDANTKAVCDAVGWIFDEAGDRPAVANLSVGSHEGPHDGSSLASRCLDNLVGPGRVIVAAAGNEAAGAEHAASGRKTLLHVRGAGTGEAERMSFVVNPAEDAQVDVWFEAGATATAVVGFVDGAGEEARSEPFAAADEFAEPALTAGATTVPDVAFIGSSQGDGQTRIEVYIGSGGAGGPAGEVTWFLEVTSDKAFDGFFDVVRGQGFVEADGSIAPDGKTTIGFPAIAANVIAVGSHKARLTWTSKAGKETSSDGATGDLSAFSGRGPSRHKATSGTVPDVLAPGENIIAALASKATDAPADHVVSGGDGDPGWAAFAGSSMASPFTAGVVALMLQADGSLDPSQVRAILRSTADASGLGGGAPSSDWGYGRIDAAAAVARVAGGDVPDSTLTTPGPPPGSGGDVDGPDGAGEGEGAEGEDEAGAGLCATTPGARRSVPTPLLLLRR